MKTEHTTGPWVIIPTLTGAISINKTPQVPIATIGGAGFHLGQDVAAANARLIAAAPDLLSALIEMVVLYADHAQYDDEEGHETAGINAARAAIAKATT